MHMPRTWNLIALLCGVALTVATLELWGIFLRSRMDLEAQPQMLRAFSQSAFAKLTNSMQDRERPWFPEASSSLHDAWRIRPLDGNSLTLAHFRGNVVFLNYWKISCAPCIAEIPSILRLRDSLANESIVFLFVTQDDEQQVRDFLKKNALDISVYFSATDIPEDLPVNGLPTTYILDPNSAAVFRHEGMLNWDDQGARAFLHHLAGH